ncbi:MAG: tetratricopeptide repeat protein [Lewinellaceae bacterium]|nr:tetratricopeptide repeat protein [Lewinellaceae bacterium]
MHYIAFHSIIAEAYRRAALAGRDMYVFAGLMEQVQTAVAAETDLYKQWDQLDDRIGEALWMATDPEPFLLVRTVFLEMLGEHLATVLLPAGATGANDWQRWRLAFSEAAFHWRFEAMQALCQTPAFREHFGEKLKLFELFLPMFRDRRWVETRAVFYDLATDKTLPDEQCGHHYYVCGQIDLYFHYEYAQAKHLFEVAETRLSGNPLAQHGKIEYYLKGPERDRDLDRALELAEAALRLDPDHIASMLQKGDLLIEKGQLAEAETLYRAASRKRPGNVLCYTRLLELYGKADFFEKKQTEIEALLHTVMQLEPDARFRTRSDVGVTFQGHGERYLPEAEKLHQAAIEVYPGGIMARLNLGYLYLDISKEYDKADAVFQEVVAMAPEAREGYLALGRLCEAQQRWEEAVTYYRQVQQIIPSWERFMLVTIGRCQREMSRLDAAEASLLRAWKLDVYEDSGAITELYELAERLYKDPENPSPEAAVQLLQRAIEGYAGSPANSASLANRQGHAFFYEERYAEALPYYRKAAEIVPTEPVYYTNQFDCLEKMYRQTSEETLFEEAVETLNRAARVAPQDISIPKKRRRLARARYNPDLAELPALQHIHVEVGQPLLSEITLDFESLLPGISARTDDLRRRMHERFAITLPGVRFRDIGDGDGAYQFRLYETPVLYEHLPATSPPTMSAVLERLESFLTSHNLDLFVNYRDVDREVPFLPNAELVHFTRTVMALLAEQVPLPPLPELHRLYRSLDGARLPVIDVVEKLRCSDVLLPNLPGVQAEFQYIRLGENEERILVACLVGADNTRALAVPPRYISSFLHAMAHRVEEHAGQHIALVVGNPDLRPFLRSVLAVAPDMPVLKTTEVPEPRYLNPLTIADWGHVVSEERPDDPVSEIPLPLSQ